MSLRNVPHASGFFKFIGIKLFIILLYYPFNVFRNCSAINTSILMVFSKSQLFHFINISVSYLAQFVLFFLSWKFRILIFKAFFFSLM